MTRPTTWLAALATASLLITGCSTNTAASPAASSSAPSSPAASSAAGKVVTLATDANYPPCESIEAGSETMVGFEPDIWNAIAAKLGITLKVENTDFDSLIPGVQSGRYDLAMECISDREAREKQVTFLDFIYAEISVVTTEKYAGPINDTDPLSVCGETMGAQTGFDTVDLIKNEINPECVASGKKEVEIKEFPDAPATYNALYAGRVDFVVQDTAAAALLNKTAPVKLVIHENSKLPKLYLGMIFNKDNTATIAEWQKGLEAIIADGTYAEILKKWDISSLALNEPGINLATTRPIK